MIQGFCSNCHKVWTLETERGVCQWCGKLSSHATRTPPRSIKSSSRRSPKQVLVHGNGYDHLDGKWLTYYKVASRFSYKARVGDTEDLLHTIIANLADAGRNDGHKPDNDSWMYRIASLTVTHYWRAYYKLNNGLDCGHCSKAQRRDCNRNWLYSECPKAIKLESLNKPVLDAEGNLTELGNLIADDKAIDLDGWVSSSTWEIGYKPRMVAIAYKLHGGEALTEADRRYLSKFRKREQIKLL